MSNPVYPYCNTKFIARKRAEAERERLLVAEREQRLLAETLAEVTLALTSQTSHEAVLDEILRQAQRLVPSSTASIMLLEGGVLRAARWHGYEEFGCEEFVSNLTQSLADFPMDAEVVQSRQPRVIPDTHQDPNWVALEDTAWIRSHIAVPICLRDRVLGLLRLGSDTSGEFSAADAQRLSPLANAAAIAMENARLFDAEARRRREAETLCEVSGALTTTIDREKILQLILEQLFRVVSYDSASVMLVRNDKMEIVAQRGFRSEVQQLPSMQIETLEHVQEVLTRRVPAIIPDTFTDERWWRHPNADYIRCWLGVPLITQDRAIGLLNLDKEQPGFYTTHDAELAVAFANQAAIAIENTRLFAETQQRFEAMTALHDISLDITANLDMAELLKTIVERAVGLLKANAGGLFLYDREQDELRAVTDYGYSEEYIGVTLKLGEGMAGKVLQTGEPLVVDDYRAWEGRAAVFDVDQLLTSILEVPMKWQEQIIGVLAINAERKFDQNDVWLATLFATQSTIAIQNVRLFEELQKRMAELQRTQIQLIQSAKMAAVGQLAAGVAHELNNPLTSMLGFSELLLEKASPDSLTYTTLTTIVQEARRASRIVRGLLDFSRQTEDHREYADLNQVVQDALALVRQQIKYNNLVLQEDYAANLPAILLDVNRMKQVFLNLITNAVQAMPDGGTLTVTTERSGDEMAVRIADTGEGITPDNLQHIFEPFFTTKPVGQGTGLGLSISQGIVQSHGGRIEVESRVGEGSTFTVWLANPSRR